MNETGWSWAPLDQNGIALVQEAEQTLGADIVLVYAPGAPTASPGTRAGLQPATLDESQLECLRGVEEKTGGIAVAYKRAH